MERIDTYAQSLAAQMIFSGTCPLLRPTTRSYTHRGRGRADQTGGYISATSAIHAMSSLSLLLRRIAAVDVIFATA